MRRRLGFVLRLKFSASTCAFFAACMCHRAAFAALPAVSLSFEAAEQRRAAERLAWELRSEGYAVAWDDAGTASPCDRASGTALPAREPHAWIRVQQEDAGELRARICYRSANGTLYDAVSTPHSGAPRELALEAAEALNGLRARLAERDVRARPAAPLVTSAPKAEPPGPRLALYAGPSLALSTGGLGPALGVQAGLDVRLTGSLSLVIEGFSSLATNELAAPDRTLSVRVTWFRVGPAVSTALGPLELGLRALAGPALVRATAEAEAPRVGGSDQTGSVQFSLGAKLSYQVMQSWFLYGAVQASTLLPRVRFELGSAPGAELGEFIADGALGVGVRLP